MHLYANRKRRIAGDRPQGVNIPCTARRVIRCVSGDTLTFTAMVCAPSTREPVSADDLGSGRVKIYMAVAETRFSPVIWAGSAADGWVVLDQHRKGLVHVTVPRTVMGVLRRGAYGFSLVVDDGVVRETQLTGSFQVEYEPTGSVNDIPYRSDRDSLAPVVLTPALDLAAQDHARLTYDQMVEATDTVSRKLVGSSRELDELLYGECEYDPTVEEVEAAVKRLSRLIVQDDALRAKVLVVAERNFDPETMSEFVDRVCALLRMAGLDWGGGV